MDDIDEKPEGPEQLSISALAARLGARGAAKGGRMRAKKLPRERRKAIAKNAADAKWNKRLEAQLTPEELANLPRATHVGELPLGNQYLECAVLEDGRRVLSQRSMGKALGRKRGGTDLKAPGEVGGGRLPFFLVAEAIKPFISDDLVAAASKPVLYRPLHGGVAAYGVEAALLPKVCDVWLKARAAGALRQKRQQRIAAQAELLMRALAHVGIIALVDEATGYQEERDRDALHKILAAYIAEELMPWTKRFPDSFYEELFRLQGWQYSPPSVRRPKQVGKITNRLVYQKLPPGVLGELQAKNPTIRSGYRRHRHHQFLTEEIGNKHLEKHLIAVTTLLRAAPDWKTFNALFEKAFPGDQRPIEFPVPMEEKPTDD